MKLSLLSVSLFAVSCAVSDPSREFSPQGLVVSEGQNGSEPYVVVAPIQDLGDGASTALGSGGEIVPEQDVFLVNRIGGVLHVVLSDRASHDAGTGPLSLAVDEAEGDHLVARREVDVATLPKVTQAVLAQTLQMRTREGKLCTATLRNPALHAFGSHEPLEADLQVEPQIEAKRVWVNDEVMLTAEVVGCEDAAFGLSSTARASFGFTDVDAATRQSALDAFRKLPAYAQIAEDQADLPNGWEEYADATPTVRTVQLGGRSFVLLDAMAGGGCGGPGGELQVLFERKGNTLEHVQDFSMGSDRTPAEGLSLADDGTITLLYWNQRARLPVCTDASHECEDMEVRIRRSEREVERCGC